MKKLRIKVTGDVQGVFYRYSAKIEADKLGVTGWTVNEPDGTVLAIVEGPDEQIERFIQWCREGSPMAEVENIEITEEEYKGEFDKFEVR